MALSNHQFAIDDIYALLCLFQFLPGQVVDDGLLVVILSHSFYDASLVIIPLYGYNIACIVAFQ